MNQQEKEEIVMSVRNGPNSNLYKGGIWLVGYSTGNGDFEFVCPEVFYRSKSDAVLAAKETLKKKTMEGMSLVILNVNNFNPTSVIHRLEYQVEELP